MEMKQPKKLLIVNILDILRKYSDEEHRLSQREITELLKSEYGKNIIFFRLRRKNGAKPVSKPF